MVERGPSSPRAFFSWRSMKLHQTNRFIRCLCSLLMPFAFGCVAVVYATTTQQKKTMREPDFARTPVMMSYISVLPFVLSA